MKNLLINQNAVLKCKNEKLILSDLVTVMFSKVIQETWRTIHSLLTTLLYYMMTQYDIIQIQNDGAMYGQTLLRVTN